MRSSHRLLSRQGRDDKRIDTEVTRYRKDGSVLGRYDSLYIVTKEDGRGASSCAAASSPSSSEAVDWRALGYFRSVASQCRKPGTTAASVCNANRVTRVIRSRLSSIFDLLSIAAAR